MVAAERRAGPRQSQRPVHGRSETTIGGKVADSYVGYRAFVASPSDVAEERGVVPQVVERVNHALRDSSGMYLDVRMWEHRPPVAPMPEEDIQSELDREASKAAFFILILGKRYGRVSDGHQVSNTEREIRAILRRRESDPRVRILSYFKELSPNEDQGAQEEQVRRLRDDLGKLSIPFRSFSTVDEFKEYLTHDLYETVLRLRLSPFKQDALRAFFQFGSVELGPLLAIVYPPVERTQLTLGSRKDYWLQRLSTVFAFEDYKTIEKITKDLRLIGTSAFEVYPHTSIPQNLMKMNRAWICLPRNAAGQQQLSRTYPRARFRISSRPSGRPGHLLWRCSNGETVKVASPMSHYLKLQRQRMNIAGEWHGQLSQIIAKDFAVLARFNDPTADLHEDGPLRDFFFAGIRGLGTWGAAWFVDRAYRQFLRRDMSGNLELLLEVTLQSGRIVAVEDVSDEPPSYFKAAAALPTIRAEIKAYRS